MMKRWTPGGKSKEEEGRKHGGKGEGVGQFQIFPGILGPFWTARFFPRAKIAQRRAGVESGGLTTSKRLSGMVGRTRFGGGGGGQRVNVADEKEEEGMGARGFPEIKTSDPSPAGLSGMPQRRENSDSKGYREGATRAHKGGRVYEQRRQKIGRKGREKGT